MPPLPKRRSKRSNPPIATDASVDPQLALTVSQVAQRLGVSIGTVRRWADAGHLEGFRTPGGQRRFNAEQVEAFVASLERRSRR
jgi:excisionase family DNA binding protein